MLSSCCSPCVDYCVEGADEFVIDSYTIRQGKIAVLEMEGIALGELCPEFMEEYKDAIAEDDILNIAIYHPTRRDLCDSISFINDNIGFRVVQGCIDIPDVDIVEVEGLTIDEAKELIQNKFRQEIQGVEVFISYKDRLSRKVDLAGRVSVPYIPVDGKMRLYEIICKASLPGPTNYYKSYVLRDGCQLPVDLYRLMNEGDLCQNIVMRGGDKIFLAEAEDSRVMIMGEVGMPRALSVPYGFLSLREALVLAGGIPFTGNKNRICVIRGDFLLPKIYILSWEHIIHLPNESLLLIPGDTVYVHEKPITQWNRFISQLLPSFEGVNAGFGTYRTILP